MKNIPTHKILLFLFYSLSITWTIINLSVEVLVETAPKTENTLESNKGQP